MDIINFFKFQDRKKLKGGAATPVFVVGGLLNTELTNDATGQVLLVDEITGSLVTIDIVHYEVHEGETFQVSFYSDSIADNASINLLIEATTKTLHFTFDNACGGNAVIEIIENPTASAGTPITPKNMSRSSSNVSTATVTHTATGISGGTELEKKLLPGGTGGFFASSAGGTARNDTEWILAKDSTYLIRLTNISEEVQPVSLIAQWYEED